MQNIDISLKNDTKVNTTLNFLLLASGRLISNLGSTIQNFALGLYVLDITKAAGAFSLILSLSVISLVLVNIFMGVFVDGHNRKKIIVGTDIISGMVVLVYLLIFNAFPQSFMLIILYTIIISTIQAVFNLAINSSIPNIVDAENVPGANAIIQAVGAGVNIVGPVIGAILYKSCGIKVIFLMNGLSLIVSGIIEMFIKFTGMKEPKGNSYKKGYLDDFKLTFKYLGSQKVLTFFFVFAAVLSLMYMPLVYMVLTYINYNILKVTELQLSFIQASIAVGTITGALIIIIKKSLSNYMMERFSTLFKIQAILFTLWMFPLFSGYFNNGKWVITIAFSIIILLTSMVNMLQNIPLISHFQALIPEELRGRIFGVFMSSTYIFSPVGMWIYGFFLDRVQWYYLTTISGVIMMLIGIFSVKNRYYLKFIAGLEKNKTIHAKQNMMKVGVEL